MPYIVEKTLGALVSIIVLAGVIVAVAPVV